MDIVPVLDGDGDGALDHAISDNVHLNATGHLLLANAVMEFLEDESTFGQTYVFDQASTGSFGTFPIHAPDGFQALQRNQQAIAIDFNDTTEELWAFESVSNSVGTIDLDSGSFTSEFEISGDMPTTAVPTGLAYDVVKDCFFASTSSELYLVDRIGFTTLVGSFTTTSGNLIDQMEDISINTNGEIYGFDVATDSLFFIEKNTGVCSFQGEYTLGDAIGNQSIDFDPANNLLYAAISTGTGTGSYGSWDVATGQFSEILPIQDFPDQVGTGYNLEISIVDQFTISTPPESITVFRGIQISGDEGSYATSDNVHASFHPGFTINNIESPIWLILESTSAQTVECFWLESHAGTPGLDRELEFWNWDSGSYQLIDTSSEPFGTDTVVIFPVEAAHISQNGEVRSRVGWTQVGFVINFPWQVNIDQAGWNE